MTKLLLSYLVYGDEYTQLFTDIALTALLGSSNLGAVKDRCAVHVMTDDETRPKLLANQKFCALTHLVPTTVVTFDTKDATYENRYYIQATQSTHAIGAALRDSCYLSILSADVSFGAGYFPALLSKMDEGHDAVLGIPIRCAAEPLAQALSSANGAVNAGPLFKAAHSHLNPLWIAAHWESPMFSRIPYCLIWSDREQMVVRPVTVSVLCQRVTPQMRDLAGCADMVLQKHFVNPYMALNWSEFPIINVEPLRCFYPPFRPGKSDVGEFRDWAVKTLPDPIHLGNLKHVFHLYDPDNRPSAESTQRLIDASDRVVNQITEGP